MAAILFILSVVLLFTIRIVAPAAMMRVQQQQRQVDAFGRPIPQAANEVSQTIVVLAGVMFLLGLFAMIAHFVSMCMSISAPPPLARSRANKAMMFFLFAFLLGLLFFFVSLCVLPFMGLGMGMAAMNQNPNNPQAAANAVGTTVVGMLVVVGIMYVIVAGLYIASHVFWMLYHVTVADAFRRPGLRAQAMILMIAWLVLPAIVFGMSFVWSALLTRPGETPRAAVIIDSVVSIVVYAGMAVWYIILNRFLAGCMSRA